MTIIYARGICANCTHFNWNAVTTTDIGTCDHRSAEVDGNQDACDQFRFNPPCLRKAQAKEIAAALTECSINPPAS